MGLNSNAVFASGVNVESFPCYYSNCRSIKNKVHIFNDFVCRNDFSVFFLTETWADDSFDDKCLGVGNYQMFRSDRRNRRGGGVMIYEMLCA